MTFNRKLSIAIVLLFVFLFCNFIVAFTDYQKLTDNNRWVSHTQQVLTSINQLRNQLARLDGTDPAGPGPGGKSGVYSAVSQEAGILRALIRDNPGQQKRLDALVPLLPPGAKWALPGERARVSAQSRQLLAEMRAEENHLLGERVEGTTASIRKTGLAFLLELAVALLSVLATLAFLAQKGRAEKALREMEKLARLGEAQAIESIKDYAIVMLDREGKILTWNAGAEKIKGYTASEIIGQNFSVFYFPEEKAKRHPEEILRNAAEHSRWEGEGWRVRKDGSRFLADVVITALKNEQGDLRGFIKVTRDVTEIKKAQRELQEKTELLDSVLGNIGDGVVVADENGKFVIFNPAAEKIIGLGAVDAPTSQWTEKFGVFLPDQVTPFPEMDLPLVKAIHGEETDEVEQFLRNANHPEGVSIHVTGRPVKDPAGQIRGGVVIVRDITEQKREEALRVYTRALEASNKEMQDFVFVVSHDLQEPLRKIQSFGNFLAEEAGPALNEAGRDYLSRMKDAGRRMSVLIEDLLQLTRVTTRAKPFETVELSRILEEVASDLEIRLKETGGKVVAKGLPLLEADPSQMRQLFQNLVNNALKFRKKDVPPVIEVAAEADMKGKWCHIRVKDNGIGFDQKYAEKIFNIFQRLNGPEYEGTGIGLAICKKVVERHRGTLRASSRPGEGALFEIVLPVRQTMKGEKE